jgi:UDP-N-acetylglucosamine--N-acetylmuramyl-(pentapeptide) pyrophosphoryl-undecaprenol N-acetylglucosamine transferase
VAHELKVQRPDAEIIYVGQIGDGLGDIPIQDTNIDGGYTVRAGKFRRYHGQGLKQLLDILTIAKNLRDAVWVMIGLVQSYMLLRKLRPDVVFVKGGFVGVPVGLAAAALRIPYVTHDSDALPGLANRIIAKWARLHAVALPKEIYQYPADKTLTVGVPLMYHYRPLSAAEVAAARTQIGVPVQGSVLLVTGGGQGAQRLNHALAASLPELLDRYGDLTVVQLAGRTHEAAIRQQYKRQLSPDQLKRTIVKGYVTNLHLYSGAADVIITRAGATSIAEFAAQQKACVVVPNPLLTGGHQLKNAKVLAERHAVRFVDERNLAADSRALLPAVTELLDNPHLRQDLGRKLGKLAYPDAAKQLAVVLLEIANR